MGQYKVSVLEKDFTRVRQYLARNLSEWYNTHVTQDGRNPEGHFAGEPSVAPIAADEYSDDEHSYMTVSINTAMSMVSVLSDEEEKPKDATQVLSSISGWPTPSGVTVASNTPSASQISTLDQSIINDLASSRKEVEALKNQVSQLVAQCELQAHQIAAAVHEQVAAALAAQAPTPPPQVQHANTITQDQFTMFVQSQDTKFDSMMKLFRDMMEYKSNHHPPELGQTTSASNKRGPPTDLDDMSQPDDHMELDSETPGSRKCNDHQQTPVKNQVQLFPLFRHDASTSSVSRTLFPGEKPQKAHPASVPLPDSPRQEESNNSTSLTAAEDVSKCKSSGTESEQQVTADHHAGPRN